MWAVGAILGELSDGQPIFPGDSDIDQLHVIQTVLGPLPQSQIEILYKNPKFIGYKVIKLPKLVSQKKFFFLFFKFPKAPESFSLRRKYNGIISDIFLDFMEGCLDLDPNKRFTINDCLQHRVFRSLQANKKATR